MHRLAVLLFCLVAPAAWAGMSLGDTRHLLARTGFDPDAEEIARWSQYGREDAIRRLVDEAKAAAPHPAPGWLASEPLPSERSKLKGKLRKADIARDRSNLRSLSGAWMNQLVASDVPLRERMVLFWHNHFTTSNRKVRTAGMVYRQHRLFEQQALGDLRQLLHAVARDPAMLVYLDGRSSRKGAANENFARELLELFTMGEGHYNERDIKEAARAFTGWTLDGKGNFLDDRKLHDAGQKTFLGKSGAFDGDDILDIILERPETAEFIVTKLWREFISPQPDAAAVKRLAAGFRKDYQVAPLLKALFQEPAFFDAANRGTLIKSPVELVVGTSRFLKTPLGPGLGAVEAVSQMGQTLFDPPTVKGWPTGEPSIDSDSLLIRYQFLARAVTGRAPPVPKRLREAAAKMDSANAEMAPALDDSPAEQRRRAGQRFEAIAEALAPATAQQVVLAVPPVEAPVEGSTPAERLRAWMLDPAYQMK